ncbi:MAG: COX15/CtaA family protein [Gaiellaceae bacterium]
MPQPHGQTSRGFRFLSLGTALAAWGLVAVGGIVRITASGLGCPHWPLCTAKAIPLDRKASVIEYSHRAVVALVVVLVVAVAVRAWRSYRARLDVFWPAVIALVLLPLQAVLGAIAVWLELPGWVVAFHFVVGMLFLATIVYTAAAAWRGTQRSATRGFARLAWGTVLVGLALISVGATIVALDADNACGKQWPACNGGLIAGGGHADVQVAHRLLAYAVAGLALALLVLALRGSGPRLTGSLPILAVLIQMTFGILIVVVGGEGRTHEILQGLHVGGSAAVWAALVALATLSGSAVLRDARRASPGHA